MRNLNEIPPFRGYSPTELHCYLNARHDYKELARIFQRFGVTQRSKDAANPDYQEAHAYLRKYPEVLLFLLAIWSLPEEPYPATPPASLEQVFVETKIPHNPEQQTVVLTRVFDLMGNYPTEIVRRWFLTNLKHYPQYLQRQIAHTTGEMGVMICGMEVLDTLNLDLRERILKGLTPQQLAPQYQELGPMFATLQLRLQQAFDVGHRNVRKPKATCAHYDKVITQIASEIAKEYIRLESNKQPTRAA